MSTSVRLSLSGKKNRHVYRIVVCETRYKRDGNHLAILGTYDPNVEPPILVLKKNELDEWIKKGAIVSDGLRKILHASPSDKQGEQKA